MGRRQGTTIGDLREILAINWAPPTNPFDEVYPGIYIGDATTAMSLGTLRTLGITHILNGASACASCLLKDNCGGCVLTKRTFYDHDGIVFVGIQANDERRFPIFRYFQESSEFIESAQQSGVCGIRFLQSLVSPWNQIVESCSISQIKRTALNPDLLKTLGITHVLNAALGTNFIRYVNTSAEFYRERDFPCEFFGVPAMDITAYQLHPFFLTTTDFIESALSPSKGKILVHCREGISRSSTLVLAYLMVKKEMTALEAIKLVRSKRQIFPNDGFLEQLCDLDLRLRGERSYRGR